AEHDDVDQRMKEPTDSDLHSIPDDEVVSISGFRTDDSNEERTEFTKPKVADKLEESVPDLIAESLKVTLPDLISESMKLAIPEIIAESVNKTIKPMNRQFNTFNKLKSSRFVTLQQELGKVLRTKMGYFIRMKVIKGMKEEEQPPKNNIMENAQGSIHLYKNYQVLNKLFELLKTQIKLPVSEPAQTTSSALVVHTLEEKASDNKASEEEPSPKRIKFLIPNPRTKSPTP
nr:hypothetical protein [Tanacetum cinerariifolium]